MKKPFCTLLVLATLLTNTSSAHAHSKENFTGNWDLGEKLVVLQITPAEDADSLLVRYCNRRFMLEQKKCNTQLDYRFNYSPENNMYIYFSENQYDRMHAWIYQSAFPNKINYEFKNRWKSDKLTAEKL